MLLQPSLIYAITPLLELFYSLPQTAEYPTYTVPGSMESWSSISSGNGEGGGGGGGGEGSDQREGVHLITGSLCNILLVKH